MSSACLAQGLPWCWEHLYTSWVRLVGALPGAAHDMYIVYWVRRGRDAAAASLYRDGASSALAAFVYGKHCCSLLRQLTVFQQVLGDGTAISLHLNVRYNKLARYIIDT